MPLVAEDRERDTSRWDYFPYVASGKKLAKKPLSVQLLVCWAFATPWIVGGIVTPQRWALALGAMWILAPFVSLARRRRGTKKP